MNVIMYTSNWCPYCVAAKNFFIEHNIKYEEIEKAKDLRNIIVGGML